MTKDTRLQPQSCGRRRDLLCHGWGEHDGMTTEAHLWNAPRPPARQPRRGQRIWSLWKHARRIDCEVRTFESGAEVQLFVDDGFYAGRRHVSPELAVRAAEQLRARLADAGWTPS